MYSPMRPKQACAGDRHISVFPYGPNLSQDSSLHVRVLDISISKPTGIKPFLSQVILTLDFSPYQWSYFLATQNFILVTPCLLAFSPLSNSAPTLWVSFMQFLFLTFLLLTIAISPAHTLFPSLVDNFSGFQTTLWRYNLKQGNSSDPEGYIIFQICHCRQSSSNMTFRSLIHLLKNPQWLLL